MNVAFAVTHYFPSVGGVQFYAQRMAQELVAQGHSVDVIAQSTHEKPDWLFGPTLDSPGPRLSFDGQVRVQVLGASAIGRRLLWLPVNVYYRAPSLAAGALRRFFAPQVRRALGPSRSVVHGLFLDMDYFNEMIWRAARRIGAAYVATPFIHTIEWEKQDRPVRLRLLRDADAVVALTPSEKAWLVQRGVIGERVHVIGAGPNLDAEWDSGAFRARHRILNHMVLFVGRQYRAKGVCALLRSAPLVWQRFPATSFVFIGPLSRESAPAFAELRDERVLNLGIVEPGEKTSAYAACDIFCLPSEVESFGCAYVEAWMMGKPVLGGPCASTRELIEEGRDGFVVEATPRGVADRILQLLAQPALARDMGANGRAKAVQHYRWDALGVKMGRLYESLVRSS